MNGITGIGARVASAYGIRPPVVSRPPLGDGATGSAPAADGGRPAAQTSDALRSVLSDEERAYFDQLAQLGPITYGPGSQPGVVPEAPRGLRLDVKG